MRPCSLKQKTSPMTRWSSTSIPIDFPASTIRLVTSRSSRLRLVRGVVVGQDESHGARPDGGLEDLAEVHEGARECADGNGAYLRLRNTGLRDRPVWPRLCLTGSSRSDGKEASERDLTDPQPTLARRVRMM